MGNNSWRATEVFEAKTASVHGMAYQKLRESRRHGHPNQSIKVKHSVPIINGNYAVRSSRVAFISMSSPVEENHEDHYTNSHNRSPDAESTTISDAASRETNNTIRHNITLETQSDALHDPLESIKSPSQKREEENRLNDELRLLQVEQQVSHQHDGANDLERSQSRSVQRERSRVPDPIDEFDIATNPIHEKAPIYKSPKHPTTAASKLFKRIHSSSVLVRYVLYIIPLVLIILIPLLLGAILFPNSTVGGVQLDWFSIWLEIVWLTLWAGRILAKSLPWPMGIVASLFTDNSKKWRDMGKQLELPATLFFWWLGIEISFLPTMTSHHLDGTNQVQSWEDTMNKVLVSFLVLAVLNFFAKIIIQLIAISFHTRTYQDRIELNKFQIGSLTKLYHFSRSKIALEDSEFEVRQPGSGALTPSQLLEKVQKRTRRVVNKFGDFTGKIAGDFTGKTVIQSNHPSQVVLTLLGSTNGSQILARRLYRTFAREKTDRVYQIELNAAFDSQDEADAAFSMFDKDMNGDISLEEFEAVCVEIGRERKSITASLKDLDSVVTKLDSCFLFLVVVIAIIVLITLISASGSTVLSSAGSTVLALSWLFSATAQEFLQSVIFVFVKHPFDVGDRVTIYGNTGTLGKGDDYFVKKISLLYTEFKKMQGQVVQAPNSHLNTLFILNMRRSGGLAEAVPMTFKFGTTLEQIEGLRQKLLEFVSSEKREYQANILTELLQVFEAHSITLNIVFFFKSNWQNELLRLQRRNKFICALMVAMQDLGIEGPRMRYPGQKESFPIYTQVRPYSADLAGKGGDPDHPNGLVQDEPFVRPAPERMSSPAQRGRSASILSHSYVARPRGESIATMGKRVDFSLGMSSISSGDMPGDVFDDRKSTTRIPINVTAPPRVSSKDRSPPASKLSLDVGHSTSHATAFGPEGFNRSSTEGSRSSTHRNRFFGHKNQENDRMMESGMAGIPEHGSLGTQRIDPRSGLISHAAMRVNTGESTVSDVGTGAADLMSVGSDTNNFEMKRL